MRGLLIACAVLALAACKEDEGALPAPVELSAEAVGYYCQMDLLKHAGPKGQIHLDGMPAPIFFSQVRDTIAYLHMPEQSHAVRASYVQDMAGAESWDRPAGWIGVSEAVYVVGSGQMGGMDAPEYVPFSDPDKARSFMAVHGGELRRFEDFTTSEVLAGDAVTPETAASDMADRLKALSNDQGSH